MTLTNLELVHLVNSSPVESIPGIYLFKSHDGVILGKVLPFVAEIFGEYPLFKLDKVQRVLSMIELPTVEERSREVAAVFADLRDKEVFEHLKGWRDERYPIYHPSQALYFLVERSGACLLGVVTYGCHINGYIPAESPWDYQIWVPRRSWTKSTFPGKLDNTVAGGLGYPYGPHETVVKECQEEAGLEKSYVEAHVKPVGVLTYELQLRNVLDHEEGVFQPEVEYIYDLIMEEGVTPHPEDGEVAEFHLMSVKAVQEKLSAGEFKYNSALVLIDFFIRHGIITPENEPDYMGIVASCHRMLPYPLR